MLALLTRSPLVLLAALALPAAAEKGKKGPEKGAAPPREPVGALSGAHGPVLVVARAKDGDWARLATGEVVYSSDELMSLPGFAAEVQTNTGVGVLLRGLLPEMGHGPLSGVLQESAAVLHAGKDRGLDLTLERGRLYLINRKEKGTARVRLRFGKKEVVDLKLEGAGAEVGVDLYRSFTADTDPRKGDPPRMEFALFVVAGKAEARVDGQPANDLEAPPGPALLRWNSATGWQRPARVKAAPPAWGREAPKEAMKALEAPLKALADYKGPKSVHLALRERLEAAGPQDRALALYALAALGDVRQLLGVLAADAPGRAFDRSAAVFCLRRWLCQGPDQARLLFNERSGSGLLRSLRYSVREATLLVDLLFDFPPEDRRRAETFEALADHLGHRRLAVRELAHWHLVRLSAPVKLPPYNAAAPRAERQKAAEAVRRLIEERKLPPASK